MHFHEHEHQHDFDCMHMSVTSQAGAYTVGNASFFRYIMKLTGSGLSLHSHEREALELLTAIPHAFFDEEEEEHAGKGWRVVPPRSLNDWPVLESTPQRLRTALETVRRMLWEHADPVGMSAREIVAVEDEIDEVFNVIQRAEAADLPITLSYVS